MIQLFKSKIFLRLFISFFLIICFTFATISFIFLTTTEVSLEKQQLDVVENYRSEAAKQIQRWLSGRVYSIRANARYLSEMPQSFVESADMQRLIKEQITWDENLMDILLINDKGDIINSVTGAQQVNLAQRQYFNDGLQGRASVTGIFRSAKGTQVMAVSEPIMRNGKMETLVVGIIGIDRVRDVVESLKFGEMGHAYLVNNTGTFVTASKFIDDFRKDQNSRGKGEFEIDSYALYQVLEKKEGTSKYIDFMGQKVFGSYQWLEELEVGLIIEFSHAAAMKPTHDLMWVVGALAVFFLLAGIFSAFHLSRQLVVPINKLVEAAVGITAKRYREPLQVKTDTELDILVDNFNQMQRAIESREHQLEMTNEELREQRAEAMEANQLKSQFLANMSHELRTPLNSIIGFTTRVIKKSGEILPPVQLENLQIVKEEAQHLLDLINNLLDYSKIEAGKMEVHIDSFNLVKVVDEVNSMVATLQESKPISYKQEFFDEKNIPMHSDRMKLKQILINLLSNAFKYSEKGTVLLKVERHGNEYIIQVKDEGVGIPLEFLERIFDEFRQVDGSYTRKVGGTGLGLSITKRFVGILGGRISVSSTVGVGTCFTVVLPIQMEELQQTGEGQTGATAEATPRKAVCIDDDPNVQRLYKQYLHEYGFEVISLHGWEDVCTQVREIMPDVILLDIMLPVKDGWEILSELKDAPETRKIPVIMVSVLSEKNLAYKMRADEYLIKPVTQDEVLEAIARTTSIVEGLDVLVADDDDKYLNLVSQFLQEEGITFRLVRNGEEALQRINERKPDLLILDIMMPKKDGFTVLEELQRTAEMQNLPVIVVTAKDLTNQEKSELRDRTKMVIQKSGTHIESMMQVLIQKIKESQDNDANSHC